MIEAHANIALGEAIRPAALAHAKVSGGGWRLILAPALAFAGAMIAASLIGMILPLISLRLEGWVGPLWTGGALFGLILALRILSRKNIALYLNGLRKLGSPREFPTRFRFDERGMAIDSDRIHHRLPWSSVLFVIPAPEHWLVQADTMTFAVPRRAFMDGAAEQAFLDLVREHLSDAARARSRFVRD
jgi:hypothetical protein